MTKFNDLLQTEQGDLLIPRKKSIEKGVGMLQVADSDMFVFVELNKPKNQYDIEPNLKHGQNWQEKARFVESEQAANQLFDELTGKRKNREAINSKYKNY